MARACAARLRVKLCVWDNGETTADDEATKINKVRARQGRERACLRVWKQLRRAGEREKSGSKHTPPRDDSEESRRTEESECAGGEFVEVQERQTPVKSLGE